MEDFNLTMSDYAENINPNDFKYTKKVYLNNVNLDSSTNYQVKLVLTSNNFNFDLCRDDGFDFRLAKKSNGSGVFKMWIAYWNKDRKYATLWFKIPQVFSESGNVYYAFWGNTVSGDISTSEELGFLFCESFTTTPLNSSKWEGTTDSSISDKGYLFPSDSSFTTITAPLNKQVSWVVEAGVYLTEPDTVNNWNISDRAHGFEFIGIIPDA